LVLSVLFRNTVSEPYKNRGVQKEEIKERTTGILSLPTFESMEFAAI